MAPSVGQCLVGSSAGCNSLLTAPSSRTTRSTRHVAHHGAVPHAGSSAAPAAAALLQEARLHWEGLKSSSSRPSPLLLCFSTRTIDCGSTVAVAEAQTQDVAVQEQQQQAAEADQAPAAVDTYSFLHTLHSLCDDSVSLASPIQLQAWAASVQPHLNGMALSELCYMASCLRHYQYLSQQQRQQQQGASTQDGKSRATAGSAGFVASPSFLQQTCVAACLAASATHQDLQKQQQQQQQDAQYHQQGLPQQDSEQLLVAEGLSGAHAPAGDMHHVLVLWLQQLLDLLQWSAAEVVQQRQLLQQQLSRIQQAQQRQQQQQEEAAGVGPFVAPGLQEAYRLQLQQQVLAQQQVQALLQHPLLLQALPHAHCYQLQQLLVCYGQVGAIPRFDWMGDWFAAARHAMADLVLTYQPHEWPQHQQQHGQHWQQHVLEHRAAAAAAYMQLVGLLSGLAASHVKPPEAWAASWQHAATTVLAAQPCFSALQHGSSHTANSSSSSSFFTMLQQLLQGVSILGLRLSADFWTAHEGLIQAQVLSFSPSELLRLLQLHQQAHLRPSKACIKYMAAVLEQHIAAQCASLQQQQEQQQKQQQQGDGAGRTDNSSSSSSMAVMQLVMCVCGLSVWDVRFHLRSVGELLLLVAAHKQQLPLPVLLQVMSILGTHIARVYSLGCSPGDSLAESTGSDSSTISNSIDGDDMIVPSVAAAAAAVAAPAPAAAAAVVEELLLYAAGQLALAGTAQTAQPSQSSSAQQAGQQQQQPGPDCGPLLKLLQISATISRNCARASSSSAAANDSPVSFTDSLTTLSAAAAAEAGSTVRSSTPAAAFLDTLVHKLHPLCAAVAPTCTPQQLLALMAAWNQLGFSTAWRFGGFKQGYKRLGQQELLQGLSGAELANAVEAVAQLPPTKSVVEALAGEVLRRQQLLQAGQEDDWTHQQAVQSATEPGLSSTPGTSSVATAEATGVTQATAEAGCEPLSAAQLLAVVCAAPKLKPHWPSEVTLLLLTHVKEYVLDALTPTQQWRLWNALQQLQQQWKPSTVAAAAAAAAAATHTDSSSTATRGDAGQSRVATPDGEQMHPAVTFAAAAATASLKGTPSPSAPSKSHVAAPGSVLGSTNTPSAALDSGGSWSSAPLVRPEHPGTPRGRSADPLTTSSSSNSELHSGTTRPQQQQQQVMRLLDELQGLVATALAKVQPDPDALPLEAAPPKLATPSARRVRTVGGRALSPGAAGQAQQQLLDAEQGQRSQQQVLAAFAKVQKSLLSPHCTGAVMAKVLEGLLLLLAVPRYATAARKHETVRRAVLRVMQAAAWPDLLAQTLDIQQLLLLTAACQALGCGSQSPYMQMVGQETSRVLADTPLGFLASGLGRVANLRLPSFKMDMVLLKFWVGRLAQAAQQQPEDALAVVVALSELGFRPGAGAAGLVLQPLLGAAAAAGAEAARLRLAQSSDDEGTTSSSSSMGRSAPARLLPASVLALTSVLADMGLNPDAESTQQLLQAQEACMGCYSCPQLLQLGRDVLTLELLTTAVPPNPAAAARHAASSSSSSRGREGLSSPARLWLLPGAGIWLTRWLKQLQHRDIAQMDVAQIVELQLHLCELDFIPWHLSSTHSAQVYRGLQQLQAKLAAQSSWQGAFAAAVQASYHATQELRRLVAARARQVAHKQGPSSSSSSAGAGVNAGAGSPAATTAASNSSVRDAVAAAMQVGDSSNSGSTNSPASANADNSTSSSSDSTGEAYSGTRKFVSRKAAVAAAAAAAGASGTQPGLAGTRGFTYPASPIHHQLQRINQQKRVLLWAALKHGVVSPCTAAWVESCCSNVLVGGHPLTPIVSVGLLTAVAEVRRNSSSSSSKSAAGAHAPIEVGAEASMRDGALSNLTTDLVGRVLSSLQLLRGAMFVQALAALSTAGVSAHMASEGTPAVSTNTAAGAEAAVAATLYTLSDKQQHQLLSDVARVLPQLQPSQLPLLVSSMQKLQLQPNASWLASALQVFSGKAAAAAAAGQPAQQLLLLAAAKQLLVCGGVVSPTPAGTPTSASGSSSSSTTTVSSPGPAILFNGAGYSSTAEQVAQAGHAVPAVVLPVAYAFRSLAAGAAHVLGSVFRRSQQQQQKDGSAAAAGSSSQPGSDSAATAAAPDTSVALLLSSLATQLQLAQAPAATYGVTTPGNQAEAGTAADVAGLFRALQARRAAVERRSSSSDNLDPQQQQQQLLAAAVLLHAGASAPLPTAASSAAAAESAGDWEQLASQASNDSRRGKAQQQQQVLLRQLLQLQLQKASGQLVQAVWGAQEQPLPASPNKPLSAADAYATQVLLDPTGDLVDFTQQQAQGAAQDAQQQQQQQPLLRPHKLVTQGLQVQFDGLLRKAFMAAAAAAAGGLQPASPASGSASMDDEGEGGGSVDTGGALQGQAVAGREPWWLPRAPRDVTQLLQASSVDPVFGPSADLDAPRRLPAGVSGTLPQAGLVAGGPSVAGHGPGCGKGEGGWDEAEPVTVLPVMCRALDVQFARLMREVLHSSCAARGGSSR